MSRLRIFLIAVVLLACAGGASRSLPAPAPGGQAAAAPLMRLEGAYDVTPLATPTELPPTPTETLVPTPELPTPAPLAPAFATWSDAPTYPTESQPGNNFKVEYDVTQWGLAQDETGQSALFHRTIPNCKIAPTGGRGLPRGLTVESQFRDIGAIRYEVMIVSQNNAAQFVNYFGSNGVVVTGFQVSFQQDQMDACLQAAENVFASLGSVPVPGPTPTTAPTITPEPTDTPTPSATP